MVVNQVPPEEQAQASLGKRIWAGFKERVRKQVVALKRSPQRIPMLVIVICTILWLFWLFTFSRAANALPGLNTLGLLIFVNTMLSILIIPLFLNAFPKRKKANVIFIVLTFIFMAGMIAIDFVYHSQVYDFIYVQQAQSESWLNERPFIAESLTLSIVHLVFVAVSVVSLALMPVYTPLIRKINTSKNIEGNDIHETIDVEDE